MTKIDQLFCTPDQGRRLKELVPELTSAFVWYPFKDGYKPIHNYYLSNPDKFAPALTLQELRDVASDRHLYRKFRLMGADRIESWHEMSAILTAPELAAWVIERLEEVQ